MWYECKIKYSRIDEDERSKTFNQAYLFDALSFTEAEARVNEEMRQYISTEFKITNIKVANFSEICPNENGDRWFKCKFVCKFVSLNSRLFLCGSDEPGVKLIINTI